MIVTVANPRRAREGGSLDVSDFSDVPGCVGVGWGVDGGLDVVFDRDLTVAEQAAVVARCEALGPNDETLRAQARAARDADRTFITTTGPQLVAGADAIIGAAGATVREKDLARGIKTLATHMVDHDRQLIGLARIVLQDLDAVD